MFLFYLLNDIIVVFPEALQDDPYISLMRRIQDKYLFKVIYYHKNTLKIHFGLWKMKACA